MPTNIKLPKQKDKPGKKRVSNKLAGRIINNITFFGDSAIPEGDPVYQSVFNAAKFLAKNDYKIINGGGPGLMKAATDGAESIDGETEVVYWEPKLASFFEGKNLANIADSEDAQSNYMMRTLGLIEKGDVYIVCKGGTGTISEFGLVWALAKLYFGVHKPVILYGNFWEEIIMSFRKNMIIDEKELGVLYYANSPEEIMELIETHERKLDKSKLRNFNGSESAFLLSSEREKTMKSYDQHASSYHSQLSKNLVAKEQLDEFIELVNSPARVLDLGCGPGYDSAYLSDHYAVTAIEISKHMAQIAQFENPNINVIHDDMLKADLGEDKYKGIWARDSIHHLHSKELPEMFKKISDALVEGGILYTIVREGEGEIIEKEKKTYGELERFYHQFSVEELTKLAEDAGLEIIKIDHTKRSHRWLVGVFRKVT